MSVPHPLQRAARSSSPGPSPAISQSTAHTRRPAASSATRTLEAYSSPCKKVTGMVVYTGRSQAEAEQKAQADIRSPAYPIPGETYAQDPALGTAPADGPPEPNTPGTEHGPAPGQRPPG